MLIHVDALPYRKILVNLPVEVPGVLVDGVVPLQIGVLRPDGERLLKEVKSVRVVVVYHQVDRMRVVLGE